MPLKSIFGRNKCLPKYTINRLQNYAVFLQSYNYETQYKKGKEIPNADCLSRLPLENTHSENEAFEKEIFSLSGKITLLNAADVAKATEEDKILKKVKDLINSKKQKT